MDNEIKKYIASVVPSNIPDKRRKLLSDELESHIYDKVDHYEEIGYTKEQSIRKALEEMGEGEEVKRSINVCFEDLYHEKTWWSILAFGAVNILNILSFNSVKYSCNFILIVNLKMYTSVIQKFA